MKKTLYDYKEAIKQLSLKSKYTNNIVKRVNQMDFIPETEENYDEDVTNTYFDKEKAQKLFIMC